MLTIEQAIAIQPLLSQYPIMRPAFDSATVGALFAFYGRCRKVEKPVYRWIDGTCGRQS